MNKLSFTGLLLLPIFLAGCLESAYRAGAPVAEHGQLPAQSELMAPKNRQVPASKVTVDEEVQVAVYTPPPRFRAKPVTSAAVAELVQVAARQKGLGDMSEAAATMERALRIEPRNAHLWNQLAQVRLAQRQYAQAENLASKSNALAATDRDLRRENWLLIEKVRRSLGNVAGARLAENKARHFR